MHKLIIVVLMLIGTSSTQLHAEGTSKVKELFEVYEKYKLCVVLLMNAATDQFGLPLQFEVDSDFYSSSNRKLYSTKIEV